MTAYRCFRCGRELSNEISVQNGIGPICASKRKAELDADQQLSRENSTCHHGFTCFAPEHGLTTIGRFIHRFHTLAEQTDLPNELVDETTTLTRQYIDALGLYRPQVDVPDIDVPIFGDAEAIRDLNLPIGRGPFGASVKMPPNYEDQYRRLKLRECKVCPFGLDCREPGAAVAAIWNLLSLMRYQVEPWLTHNRDAGAYGWEWDLQIYQDLANCLDVLGLDDDGRDIQDIAHAQHDKRFAQSKRYKSAAKNATLW